MSKVSKARFAWGVLRRTLNRLDGDNQWLEGAGDCSRTRLFETRKQARDYIKKVHGYIADRPDLKSEPHGWKMPIAVRVRITVSTL